MCKTTESCGIYFKSEETWKAGKSYEGGSTRRVGDPPERILRALDIHTGKIAWELPQKGRTSWGGVLSTVTGLVFFGEDSGAFAAIDGSNGKLLWHFQTNQIWKASPMTYRFDGKQYVSVRRVRTYLHSRSSRKPMADARSIERNPGRCITRRPEMVMANA